MHIEYIWPISPSHISRIHNSITNECNKRAAPSTPTIDFGGGGIFYIEEISLWLSALEVEL